MFSSWENAHMRRVVFSLALAAVWFSWAPARGTDPWNDYQFLIGTWSGEGKGAPGQGKGRFTFAVDLQGKVLVRKHRAEIASQGDRPAFHEDLMIIYPEGGSVRAIYFDNEGHVIHYAPHFSPDKKTLAFVSVGDPRMPHFRLSYTKQSEDALAIKFEMAPPGKPDAFKTYTQGTATREPEGQKDAAKRQ